MHYLTIQEMLQAAIVSKLPTLKAIIHMEQNLAAALGDALAKHLGIDHTFHANSEPQEDITLVGFEPPDNDPFMQVPYCIASYDEGSDWLEENGSAPDPDAPPAPELVDYTVRHVHNGGVDTYKVRCGHRPTYAEIAKALGLAYDAAREERLFIEVVNEPSPVVIPEPEATAVDPEVTPDSAVGWMEACTVAVKQRDSLAALVEHEAEFLDGGGDEISAKQLRRAVRDILQGYPCPPPIPNDKLKP